MSDTPISVTVLGGDTAISGSGYGDDGRGDVGIGVAGASDVGTGVFGASQAGVGVQGESESGAAVAGHSSGNDAVWAVTDSRDHAGVSATNRGGGPGIWAQGTPAGYFRSTGDTDAITCESGANAVAGISTSPLHSGVIGINDAGGFGVWGRGRVAGHFEGDVEVTGTVAVAGDIFLQNAGDLAELFPIDRVAQPGTVMVVDESGRLGVSTRPYDTRVAGVICGAGSFRTGLVLGQATDSGPNAVVALVGRVFCLADATRRPIRSGDALTTAGTPGQAMRAVNRRRSRGAVLGKALAPLPSGHGLIPILVALQ